MSRRPPNPAAERAAQNQQTIKSLLKLEGNKTCADCKRNKHPRWASWNLGIFICIRCSGIHRGMGTHISRVKSVDLDAWTDEQLQSVLKWGNTRANKYWEAKLAPGHVPSEAKIENFIRTKYESKRWVMDGGIPDPSTLDAEGDDDIPLGLVKEKHNIERSTSQRASSAGGSANVKRAPPSQDLFGDTVARPATTSPAPKAPPKPEVKQSKPADSLLGLDFFGTESAPPSRPAATPSGGSAQSRPDLKQSILSLYASTPKPAPVQQQHSHTGSIGGMQSPPATSQGQSAFGGLNDAFSSLSFSSTPQAQPQAQPKSSAFAGLGDFGSSRPSASSTTSSFGGSFFDTKPTQKSTPAPPVQTQSQFPPSDFGAFTSASPPAPTQTTSSSAMGDLFDLSAPTSTVTPPAPPKQTMASPQASVFNLSSPKPTTTTTAPPAATSSGWASNDAWGSTNAWSTPDPEPVRSPAVVQAAPAQASAGDFGWGSTSSATATVQQPKVSADDDFGGWSSAPPVTSTTTSKPATGFTGGEDLFSNVWGD